MPILARIRDGAVIALCCAGAVACLAVAVLVWEWAGLARELALTAQEVRGGAKAAFAKFDAALTDWQASSRKSLAYADWMMVNSNQTIKEIKGAVQDFRGTVSDIRAVIGKTDENLNGKEGALPALTAAIRRTETISAEASAAIAASRTAIEDASSDLHSTAAGMDATLAGVRNAAAAATAAIEQMSLVVRDPAVINSIRNVESTTAKSAETMIHVEQMTARWAKPPRLIWEVLSAIGGTTYRVFIKP